MGVLGITKDLYKMARWTGRVDWKGGILLDRHTGRWRWLDI